MKIVVFSGQKCPSCKQLKDALDIAGIEYELKEVLECLEEVKELGIRGIPTTVVYDSIGDVIGKVVGNKLNEILEVMKDAK